MFEDKIMQIMTAKENILQVLTSMPKLSENYQTDVNGCKFCGR
jgi:hypothetical protein